MEDIKELKCPKCGESFLSESQAPPFAKRFDKLIGNIRQEERQRILEIVFGELQSRFNMKKECLDIKDFEELKLKYLSTKNSLNTDSNPNKKRRQMPFNCDVCGKEVSYSERVFKLRNGVEIVICKKCLRKKRFRIYKMDLNDEEIIEICRECFCPEIHIIRREIANTPEYLRRYFEEFGRKNLKTKTEVEQIENQRFSNIQQIEKIEKDIQELIKENKELAKETRILFKNE